MFLFLFHISSIKCLNDHSYVTKYNPLHQVICNLHVCLVTSIMHKTNQYVQKIRSKNYKSNSISSPSWSYHCCDQHSFCPNVLLQLPLSSPSCLLPQLVFHCYSHISSVVFIVYRPFPHHYFKLFKMSPMLVMLVFKTPTKLNFPINILGFNVPFWNMFKMFVTMTFAISTNTIRSH